MRGPDAGRPTPTASAAGPLARDSVGFAVAFAAVLVVFVYLPIGIAAAVAQDGYSEEMRRGLGSGTPLPLRLFRFVQANLRLWPAAAAVAFAHVAMRRLVRKGVAFGDSLAWDSLTSPLLTTAVGSAVGSAWAVAAGGGDALDSVVWPGLGIALGAFLSLAIAGLVFALAWGHRGVRVALAAALVTAVAVRLGAEAWGRAALASHREERAAQVTAEDAAREAAVRPVLRGLAVAEDAWPRYEALIDGLRTYFQAHPEARSVMSPAHDDPFAPIPAPAKAVLDARRGDVAALREATRCTRLSPPLGGNPVERVPSLIAARYLATLASLEGHERAQGGDVAGAAERYLDVVRFGGDLGRGQVIHALLGSSAEQQGLMALGRLVRAGRMEPTLLDRVESERELLERDRSSLAHALLNERRSFDDLGAMIDAWPSNQSEPLVLPAVVPYRALAAHAVRVAFPLRREFEEAAARDDFEAWKKLGERSDAVAGRSWNPLLRIVMGYDGVLGEGHGAHSHRLFLTFRQNLARFRLVQAAVVLEREKRARGRYPSDASAVELPRDPFAPAQPLSYRPDGSTYRLWSVGIDGVDGGGDAEKRADEVL
jgi:hypothetical protein